MNRTTQVILVVAVVVALATGYFFGHREKTAEAPAPTAANTERKVLYWTDPMVPGYRSDKPGKSPFMDMELVPVYEDEAAGNEGAPVVTVRPEFIQNFNVRTHKVTSGAPVRTLTTQGYVFRESGKLLALVDGFDRAAWVRAGLPAEVRVPDLPGRQWNGTVESVGSDVDVGTRSFRARVRITDPDPLLKSNMYADIVIKDTAQRERKVMVPREALIRTGTRNAVVLALGDGRFQPVEVVPGEESGDWVEIRRGVKEGDTVVTSGQFLIDSEASVRASFQRMESTPADPHAGHKEAQP